MLLKDSVTGGIIETFTDEASELFLSRGYKPYKAAKVDDSENANKSSKPRRTRSRASKSAKE